MQVTKRRNDGDGATEDGILSIEFPPDGKLRWRKVVRRSGTRPTGKFPSPKNGRMAHWESIGELNAFRLLEAMPTIKQFHEQRLCIRYVLNGVPHYHIPDILLFTDTGEKILWEIKIRRDANDPEVAARTRLLTEKLPTLGYQYQVVLAEDLAAQPRLNQILTVLRQGRLEIPAIERERLCRTFLCAPNAITWKQVEDNKLGDKGKAYVCRLWLEGFLEWDPTQPLTGDTILRPIQHNAEAT